MTNFIKKIVFYLYESKNRKQIREIYGIFCSIIGLASNIVLFILKLIIGSIFSSISVVADSFNNLSDVLSYTIIIIGFKFTSKIPDQKHPFGYGRIEYACSLIICSFIFMTGIELLKSSIVEIINPSEIEISQVIYVVLSFSILLKFWLSRFFKRAGNEIKSSVLIANSRDSFMDMFSTLTVLIGIFVSSTFNLSLDGYLSLIVSLFIIYTSFKTFKENIGSILGEAPNKELVSLIEEKIKVYEEIEGLENLSLHDYGPSRTIIYLKVRVKEENLQKLSKKISIIEQNLSNDLLCKFNISFTINFKK